MQAIPRIKQAITIINKYYDGLPSKGGIGEDYSGEKKLALEDLAWVLDDNPPESKIRERAEILEEDHDKKVLSMRFEIDTPESFSSDILYWVLEDHDIIEVMEKLNED